MNRKFCVVLMVLALAFSTAFCAVAEETSVSVTGTGVVYVDADQVTVTVGVRETADDVMQAQASVNEKIEAVILALTEKGVQMSDIYTNSISIYPNYDYSSSQEKIVSYTAYNSITALTTDTEGIGAYIDAAFAAGANTLDNVNFSASDTQDASYKAIELGIAEATRKADVIANAVGMKVTGIESIQEESGYNSYRNTTALVKEAMLDGAGSGTQVLASQLEVIATVNIQFEIEKEQ